jgi:hypothetical protein
MHLFVNNMADPDISHYEFDYDVTLFMCQSRSTIFPGILVFVIFRPMDMQEYIFMFSIALEWIVNSICDHLRRMHLFVNNMADPDISHYEFDADGLFRR